MSPVNETQNRISYPNLLLKTLSLFILLNMLFAWIQPLPALGKLSVYNNLIPGRIRLPYSDVPQRSYNLSLYNLEAMFASHEVSAVPHNNEFRVMLIGDSSTWGFLLEPNETLAAYINSRNLILPDGRVVKAYNLGYPVMSLVKDLLILSYAMEYQPDMIIWLFTLESFPYDKQLFAPLLQNNAVKVRALDSSYDLDIDPYDSALNDQGFLDRTIIGERRVLADIVRLQLYGIMWAATGIDQFIPANYTERQVDLSSELSFHNLQPPQLNRNDLAIDALQAGVSMSGEIPILFINEPIFISWGVNSDIRYNFYYPRWVYDDYRELLASIAQEYGWSYHDYWDSVPAEEFTNTAIHLTPAGSAQLADLISRDIQGLISGLP
ncbi:MAG: hypothetical protein JSV61_13805 [Anaerolineales bacterium]|nr:MAG: hypothetical protein JSV61_13805 [Anaerolineales bacterium]